MSSIAIIGAGMAGLAAAHGLHLAGRDVTVFDKSRGTGGRLATRRGHAGSFDHGAPLAQGDAAFDAAMAKIGAQPHGPGWRGTPGMSGLVKPLADGLRIVVGCRITSITGQRGAWHLKDDSTAGHGPFTDLIVAIPAPQAATLVPAADLSRVEMAPQWTLMAVWPDVVLPESASPFSAICPQGRDPDVPGALVAHATPEWSRAHLEDEPETVKDALVDALLSASAESSSPVYATAHRWLYARTVRPLGSPFQSHEGMLLGGDWTLGPNAGDAWRSGRAMAQALLS